MPLLEPVKADFGTDGNKQLDEFVFSNLTALINSYFSLHNSTVQKWRRLTKGKPKEETRNFPWENAANTIVQLIGENVDVIKAVQLGTIYEILPLWTAGLVGDWPVEARGEEQRSIVERFLDQMGLSKSELDLYRVESKAAHDIASLGSVVIKIPWETKVQQIVTGIDSDGQFQESEEILYDGPRPEKLAYEDWAATPTAQTWEDAKFKYHEYRITKQECEFKVYKGHFDKDAWKKIKGSPDVIGLTSEEEEKIASQNLQSGYQDKELARWRFYECWFEYQYGNKKYSIIYTMHLEGKHRMGAFFNFYPKNEEPFEFGRLGFSEDGLLGYGFAEMGEMYQEECSTTHNQRMDNRTLLNTSVLLGGNNPRIDAGISLFPMAVLPFNKDEVEIVSLGAKADSSVPEEQLTIALAKARFGTDMPMAEGAGSGSVGKKGTYSSMGTFSIMQQGARRININITDFRFLHLNLGQKFLKQYAFFGVGDERLKYYGQAAEDLRKAMNAIKEGRLELPIKAATASINKEIEKQTGMLFTQVMQRHYGAIAQILQGVVNPTIPEQIRDFLIGSIGGMAYVMSKLARAFGYDDVSRMQPELKTIQQLQEMKAKQEQQEKQQQQRGANSNGQRSVQQNAGGTPQGNGRPGIQENTGPQDAGISPPASANANADRGILLSS